jgi:arylsulfatase
MATCCDVAQTEYPQTYKGRNITPLAGKSLVPVLKGGTRKGHEALYFEHIGHMAIRAGDRKLVRTKKGPWELYDLKADRTELNNLAQQYPDKAKELYRLYNSWAKKWGVRTHRFEI